MATANCGEGPFPFAGPGDIDALPCLACGKETLSIVELETNGVVVRWSYYCRPCQEIQNANLAQLRAQFDAMIAAGISRETANAVMIRWHVRPSRSA